MAYEYRLEDVDADKTAKIKRKKEEQRTKQEEAWGEQKEDPKAPPAEETVRS